MKLYTDGEMLFSGNFKNFDGVTRWDYLVRLNEDGTPDIDFNEAVKGLNNPARFVDSFEDGVILVGAVYKL